jgi:hypothetical protein
LVSRRHDVTTAVHRAGYRYVTVDLDGFRSGNLNDALVDLAGAPVDGLRRPAGAPSTGTKG